MQPGEWKMHSAGVTAAAGDRKAVGPGLKINSTGRAFARGDRVIRFAWFVIRFAWLKLQTGNLDLVKAGMAFGPGVSGTWIVQLEIDTGWLKNDSGNFLLVIAGQT